MKLYATVKNASGKIVKIGDNSNITISITNGNREILNLLALADSNMITIHKPQGSNVYTTKGNVVN